MGTPLNDTEQRWGICFGLLYFLVLPQFFRWVFLSFPDWVPGVCLSFLGALLTVLIYRRFLICSITDGLARWPKLLAVSILGLVLYFAASIGFAALSSALFPGYVNLNDQKVLARINDGGIWVMMSAVLAAPITEEAIFRGLAFRGLYAPSAIGAWCLSTAMFSLIHVAAYIGQYTPFGLLLAFLQYLPAGICLCLGYRLSGNFLCPLFMHMMINLIAAFCWK